MFVAALTNGSGLKRTLMILLQTTAKIRSRIDLHLRTVHLRLELFEETFAFFFQGHRIGYRFIGNDLGRSCERCRRNPFCTLAYGACRQIGAIIGLTLCAWQAIAQASGSTWHGSREILA